MPRKLRDERLETRTGRLRLAPRREPYWRTIQEGRAVGYRRLAGRAGTWVARHYKASGGRTYQALGTADDMADADGTETLTFAQAQDAAAAWFAELLRHGGKMLAPVTVREAMEAYLRDYTARGGKSLATVRGTFAAHILPTMGDVLVTDLTTARVREWHRSLSGAPALLRPGRGRRKVREAVDADGQRARRATANRVLTVLKAALNCAFREGRVPADEAWRRVQPFAKVDAARIRYLSDDEAHRLLNACPGSLRDLVAAALLTGCRYGELAALRVADIDLAAGVLTVRAAKGGTARAVVLTDEAAGLFRRLVSGRAPAALVLTRDDGDAWGKAHQSRPLRLACAAARIVPAASFHILRHTHASRLAMRGVPMAVIAAQLGHANLTMTTKHYAHLSPGYVADTVRQAFGTLGITDPAGAVVPLRRHPAP